MRLDIDTNLLTYASILYLKRMGQRLEEIYPLPEYDMTYNLLTEEFKYYKAVLDLIPSSDKYTQEEQLFIANRIYHLKGLTDSLVQFGELFGISFTFELTTEGILVTEVSINVEVYEVEALLNALEDLIYDLIFAKELEITITDLTLIYEYNYTPEIPTTFTRLSSFYGRFIGSETVSTPSVSQSGNNYSWTLSDDCEGIVIYPYSPGTIFDSDEFPRYIPKSEGSSVNLSATYSYRFRSYTREHLFSDEVQASR